MKLIKVLLLGPLWVIGLPLAGLFIIVRIFIVDPVNFGRYTSGKAVDWMISRTIDDNETLNKLRGLMDDLNRDIPEGFKPPQPVRDNSGEYPVDMYHKPRHNRDQPT